ncbi:MAG: TetR/AcrR family transcriptional regulator [bacterium]
MAVKKSSRPRIGRPKSRSDRREEIRNEIEKIFLQEGFRDLTVDKLAKRVKCSNRTLYDIAPSKEELFLVTLNRLLERIRHRGWQSALKYQQPSKRIENYLNPGVTEMREAGANFVEDVRTYLPAKQMLAWHQEERMKFLEDIIEDGIRQGAFRDVHPALVAEILLSAVTRIDELDYQTRSGLTFSESFKELYGILLNGLVRP